MGFIDVLNTGIDAISGSTTTTKTETKTTPVASNTGMYIAIGVVAAVVITTVIIVVVKK